MLCSSTTAFLPEYILLPKLDPTVAKTQVSNMAKCSITLSSWDLVALMHQD